MIKCTELFEVFKENSFTYFTGVPDSTFKQWMSFLDDNDGKLLTNRIAAIERDAVSWAAGYHAATGKVGVVYMQNSGLGNVVNPLTSLIDPYHIPMLFLVGWRGEPEKKDEPQHITMGPLTIPLLHNLGIRCSIMPDNIEEVKDAIIKAKDYIVKTGKTYALVIRKGTFDSYTSKKTAEPLLEMKREEAVKKVVDLLDLDTAIVSTTGKTSRELFEYREEKNAGHQNDFLMVGSMGCAASFGAEIALKKPNKKVFVFDGDGALIMSAGALSTISYYKPSNFYHIVFDNAAYESTGGQPTTSPKVDFEKLAMANGYTKARTVSTKVELENSILDLQSLPGPQMLIVKVAKGSRKDLGRPTTTPIENKKAFMNFLDR